MRSKSTGERTGSAAGPEVSQGARASHKARHHRTTRSTVQLTRSTTRTLRSSKRPSSLPVPLQLNRREERCGDEESVVQLSYRSSLQRRAVRPAAFEPERTGSDQDALHSVSGGERLTTLATAARPSAGDNAAECRRGPS